MPTERAHGIAKKKYDTQFKVVFDAIEKLMMPPDKPKSTIGFIEGKKKS